MSTETIEVFATEVTQLGHRLKVERWEGFVSFDVETQVVDLIRMKRAPLIIGRVTLWTHVPLSQTTMFLMGAIAHIADPELSALARDCLTKLYNQLAPNEDEVGPQPKSMN